MDYVSFLLNQSNDPIEQLKLLRKNKDKLEVKIFIDFARNELSALFELFN